MKAINGAIFSTVLERIARGLRRLKSLVLVNFSHRKRNALRRSLQHERFRVPRRARAISSQLIRTATAFVDSVNHSRCRYIQVPVGSFSYKRNGNANLLRRKVRSCRCAELGGHKELLGFCSVTVLRYLSRIHFSVNVNLATALHVVFPL